MAPKSATIHERGNGFPDVGDFVIEPVAGEVYRVISFDGPIQRGSHSGASDWIAATVELADWSDCDDDSEPTCSATIDGVRDGIG